MLQSQCPREFNCYTNGSQAGTGTYLLLIPKQKLAIALMTDLERALCEEFVPTIIATLDKKIREHVRSTENCSQRRPVDILLL